MSDTVTKEPLRKIVYDSLEYRIEANALARSFCPTIYPCAHCGNPVAKGYCCYRCGSGNPEGKY